MKKKYVNPISSVVTFVGEGMIANSMVKSGERADGNFKELTKERNPNGSIWGDADPIWK